VGATGGPVPDAIMDQRLLATVLLLALLGLGGFWWATLREESGPAGRAALPARPGELVGRAAAAPPPVELAGGEEVRGAATRPAPAEEPWGPADDRDWGSPAETAPYNAGDAGDEAEAPDGLAAYGDPDATGRSRLAAPAAAPKRPPRLRGMVVSGEEGPIEGAQVLVRAGGRVLGEDVAEDTGGFELVLSAVAKEAEIEVRARGHAPLALHVENLRDGENRHLGNLVVERGVVLEGLVVDADDAPVPDADVQLRDKDTGPGSNRFVQRTRSDAQGRFRFPAAPPGGVHLVATAAGHGAGDADATATQGGGEVRLVLGPERVLPVRLVDREGHGLAGLLVRIGPAQRLGDEREERTDAEGRCLFRGLADAEWDVRVLSDAHRPVLRSGVPAKGEELVLPLSAWPSIAGRVAVPGGGKPPEGTEVLAVPSGQHGDLARYVRGGGVPILPDGGFRIPGLRPGHYVVRADAPGYAASFSNPVQLSVEGEVQAGTVLLRSGGSLELEVRLDGDPLGGARLELYASQPAPALLWLEPGSAAASPDRVVTSDAEGKALVEHLEPGAWWILARGSDAVPGLVGPLTLGEERRSEGTVRLQRGGRVQGRVVENGGKPTGNALITFSGHPAVPSNVQVACGPDGRFLSPPLPPGTWELRGRWVAGRSRAATPKPTIVKVEAGKSKTVTLEMQSE